MPMLTVTWAPGSKSAWPRRSRQFRAAVRTLHAQVPAGPGATAVVSFSRRVNGADRGRSGIRPKADLSMQRRRCGLGLRAVPVGRNDVDVVGFDEQVVCDDLDRHARKPRQHFMQLRRHRGDVIHDGVATPMSAGRCFSRRMQTSRPPAEPLTQTAGILHSPKSARARLPGLFVGEQTLRHGSFKLCGDR